MICAQPRDAVLLPASRSYSAIGALLARKVVGLRSLPVMVGRQDALQGLAD
jgi:hypothetical protein